MTYANWEQKLLSASQRSTVDKIQMIKALRYLTIVLGRLGIQTLQREHSPYRQNVRPWTNPGNNLMFDKKYVYGWGLKEAKDFTELYLDRKARSTST